MSYKVLAIPPFDRQLKRLAKKYPSLKGEFANLLGALSVRPTQGVSLGNDCYKIRIAIGSKGKGKSGGARIITNVVVVDSVVYLLSMYDKSEKADITDKELRELLQFTID